MITEAEGAGQHVPEAGDPVPRIQIVTIEQAMALHHRAVQLPLRYDNFKKAAKEADTTAQGALDI